MLFFEKIREQSSWKRVFCLFIMSMFLATTIISQIFGFVPIDGRYTMDASKFYTGVKFYENLSILGEEGRRAYLHIHVVDYLFILFSYSFYTMLLILLIKEISKNQVLKWIIWIPLFAGAFDLLENLCIDFSIVMWPSKLWEIANMSGYFTVMKMNLIYVTYGMIFVLGIGLLVKKTIKMK